MSFGKNISTLKLPHHKQTSGMASEPITPSAEVLLPMNMHSGQAAVPVVEVGQHVYRGQLIERPLPPFTQAFPALSRPLSRMAALRRSALRATAGWKPTPS